LDKHPDALLSACLLKSKHVRTQSQENARGKIMALAELFFETNELCGLSIKPRFFPLIVGPTGAGKTMLIREAAESLGATLLRITFGDWMPRGIRGETGTPTSFQILSLLESNPRVVLHVDELDKWQEDFASSWSRSVAADLWNVLDKELPLEEYLKSKDRPKPRSPEELARKVRENLWIVGSGTWQSVFNQATTPSCGFVSGHPRTEISDDELTEKIVQKKMIPDELLSRFAADLIFLRYPATPEEIQRLLDESGISQLARRLETTVTIDDVNFDRKGMRILESLATRLLVLKRSRDRESGAATDHQTATARTEDLFREKIIRLGNAEPRLRWYCGKTRRGWGRVIAENTAYLGIDPWCQRYHYPLPPPTPANLLRKLEADPSLRSPRSLASPSELFQVLRRGLRLRIEAKEHRLRYATLIKENLSSTAAKTIEAQEEYCIAKALRWASASENLGNQEIVRHIREEVVRGAVLAADWQIKSKAGKINAEALEARIHELWSHAMDCSERMSQWDGVSEYFERLFEMRFLEDLDATASWKSLPPEFQQHVTELFVSAHGKSG
jgi:hypothetical protein